MSGPEKSRQTRHSSDAGTGGVAGAFEPSKRGLVAKILDRSGREPCGIGGGVPPGAVLLGRDGRLGLLLPNPNCRASCILAADGGGGSVLRMGKLGATSGDAPFWSACAPDGRRGGSLGTGASPSVSRRGG